MDTAGYWYMPFIHCRAPAELGAATAPLLPLSPQWRRPPLSPNGPHYYVRTLKKMQKNRKKRKNMSET
jgi:hypothetical protein